MTAVHRRHRPVLDLLAQGRSNQQIARTLQLSPKTVKNYVSELLEAHGLTNRTELALWWQPSATPPEGGDCLLTGCGQRRLAEVLVSRPHALQITQQTIAASLDRLEAGAQ